MELSFTESQQAVRDLARRIFDGHVTRERIREIEAEPDRFDRVLWAELARAQLLGAGIAERSGGIGGGMMAICLLLEEAGRAAAPIPLWAGLVGGLAIDAFGSTEQREAWLRPFVTGEVVLSCALVEPGSDDPVRPDATALDGRLTGVKTGVPAAGVAARLVVPAVAASGPGLFLVDPSLDEAALERQESTSGEPEWLVSMRGVPAEALAGGDQVVTRLLERAVTALCAVQVGIVEHALQLTASHIAAREQFGKPLATFQAVQQRIADAYIDVQAMRWTMWQAAWRLDEELPAEPEVAVAKYWAAEGGHRVLAAAQHLHGGLGVDNEYPLHRYTVRAKQIEVTLGGATQQLARLGGLIAAGADR